METRQIVRRNLPPGLAMDCFHQGSPWQNLPVNDPANSRRRCSHPAGEFGQLEAMLFEEITELH